MAENNEQIAAAFGYAAEKLVKTFGNGPYDGLRTIGDTYGRGFAMTANVTKQQETIDRIPFGHIMVFWNGLPCGMISPYDGILIAMGEHGETEQEFIKWCHDAFPEVAR